MRPALGEWLDVRRLKNRQGSFAGYGTPAGIGFGHKNPKRSLPKSRTHDKFLSVSRLLFLYDLRSLSGLRCRRGPRQV
jgi:hypothetical protein